MIYINNEPNPMNRKTDVQYLNKIICNIIQMENKLNSCNLF